MDRQQLKGDRLFMANKEFTRFKLILVVALVMVAVGVVSLGARQTPGVSIPPGPIVVAPNAKTGDHKALVVPAAPALPAAQSPAALEEDFSGDLSKWQTVQTAPATWAARDGRLQQWGDANGEPSDEPSVLVRQDTALADGRVEAQIFPTAGDAVGLVFRGSDAGYYRLDLYPNLPNKSPKALLYKVTSNGAAREKIAETAASAWQGYAYSAWQLVTIDLAGKSISVSVDGTQVLSASDSSLTVGWAGVWTLANFGAQFDNVRIQPATSR